MSRTTARLVVALVLVAPIALYARQAAQAPAKKAPATAESKSTKSMKSTMSDAQKIASAEGAAPAAISKQATIMDWPEKEGAKMRQLRAGTNGWMCMPESPTEAAMPAMCADKQWQGWADAFMSHGQPKTTATGIAYMLKGDHGASNTDPMANAPTPTNQWVVTPAHIMLLFPDAKMLDAYPTDPKNGGPWVMWKGTPYAHVMVPVSATSAAKMGAAK